MDTVSFLLETVSHKLSILARTNFTMHYWVIKKSVEANKEKEQEKNMKEKEENNKKTI